MIVCRVKQCMDKVNEGYEVQTCHCDIKYKAKRLKAVNDTGFHDVPTSKVTGAVTDVNLRQERLQWGVEVLLFFNY